MLEHRKNSNNAMSNCVSTTQLKKTNIANKVKLPISFLILFSPHQRYPYLEFGNYYSHLHLILLLKTVIRRIQ